MPVYKSRIKSNAKRNKPRKPRKGGSIGSKVGKVALGVGIIGVAGRVLETGIRFGKFLATGDNLSLIGSLLGGSLSPDSKLNKKIPKKFRDFMKDNPKESQKIIKEARTNKGGGLGKVIAKGSASIAVVSSSIAIGVIGFREYLIRNPQQVAKLVGESAKVFFGGSLKDNLKPFPKNVQNFISKNKRKAIAIASDIFEERKEKGAGLGQALKQGAQALSTASLATRQALGAFESLKGGSIQDFIRKLPNVNVSKFDHRHMISYLNHIPDKHFKHIQGIVAHSLGKTKHKLFKKIDNAFGGKFKGEHPSKVSKVASRDILKAKDKHHLAAVLHGELMDKERGSNTGGGLLDSLKAHLGRAVKFGRSTAIKGAKGVLKVGDHLNQGLIFGLELIDRIGELSRVAEKSGFLQFIPKDSLIRDAIRFGAEIPDSTLTSRARIAQEFLEGGIKLGKLKLSELESDTSKIKIPEKKSSIEQFTETPQGGQISGASFFNKKNLFDMHHLALNDIGNFV